MRLFAIFKHRAIVKLWSRSLFYSTYFHSTARGQRSFWLVELQALQSLKALPANQTKISETSLVIMCTYISGRRIGVGILLEPSTIGRFLTKLAQVLTITKHLYFYVILSVLRPLRTEAFPDFLCYTWLMVLASVFPYVLSDFPTTPQPLHRPLQMNPKNVAKIPLIHLDICACFCTGPTMESFLDWKKGKTILGTFGTNKIDRRRGAKGRSSCRFLSSLSGKDANAAL